MVEKSQLIILNNSSYKKTIINKQNKHLLKFRIKLSKKIMTI
jgi:hypothetical protein